MLEITHLRKIPKFECLCRNVLSMVKVPTLLYNIEKNVLYNIQMTNVMHILHKRLNNFKSVIFD